MNKIQSPKHRIMTALYGGTSDRILRPNVKVRSCSYDDENATQVVRTEYVTPYGNLSTLSQPAFNASWTMKSLFKSPACAGDFAPPLTHYKLNTIPLLIEADNHINLKK